MLFKSFAGKSVLVKGKRLVFDEKGQYETEDKAEVEALGQAKNVEKVDARKQRQPE